MFSSVRSCRISACSKGRIPFWRRTGTSGLLPVPRRSVSGVVISAKVKEALECGKPVVCLESTIITHGMAYPANLSMAKAVEKVIEDHGAVPATIAVLEGQARVGLNEQDLELLARTGQSARKISRRDLAAAMADKATGGTTVSGTMILAKKSGIKVFVTGGIGGVHRNAENTMDISNDLNELSKNDVTVVCAGPKAILDIPRTLEYLETMGVTVTTLGQQNLPAFYSRDSGIKSPQMSASTEHAARMISSNLELGLGSAILVCVPIPEESSIKPENITSVIDKAIQESYTLGIGGKDSTPFLLAAVATATEGRSLKANIALVMENARVGAEIACHLAEMDKVMTAPDSVNASDSSVIAKSLLDLEEGFSINAGPYADGRESIFERPLSTTKHELMGSQDTVLPPSDVLVVGGVAVDITCSITTSNPAALPLQKTSYPGRTSRSIGGVAGNIARAVAYSDCSVCLTSVVGAATDGLSKSPALVAKPVHAKQQVRQPDVEGTFVVSNLKNDRVRMNIDTIVGTRTATYTCVQVNSELLVAVADMDIFDTAKLDFTTRMDQRRFRAIIVDANVKAAFRSLSEHQIKAEIVCFEPTSVPKAVGLFTELLVIEDDHGESTKPDIYPRNFINMTTPNVHELQALFESGQKAELFETSDWWDLINSLNITSDFRMKLEVFLRAQKEIKLDLANLGVVQQAIHLLPFLENIYLTLGSSGVMSFHLVTSVDTSCSRARVLNHEGVDFNLQVIYHPAVPSPAQIVSDTGCGDTFTGVLVSGQIQGLSLKDRVRRAQKAAVLTLESAESVSPRVSELVGTSRNEE